MKIFFIIFSLMILTVNGSAKNNTKADPLDETFYKKVRFIMLKKEIEIYKNLRDKRAKEEFIKEFWKKRDPDPNTEENEFKMEYVKRIEFANKEFTELRAKGRGWDTERGRILLQLGFPDQRERRDLPRLSGQGNFLPAKKIEIWTYFNYGMQLVFMGYAGRSSVLELLRVPAKLTTTVDKVKHNLITASSKAGENSFRFSPKIQKDKIIITIPVDGISFEEKDGNMVAKFKVEIYVYRNNKKIKRIITHETISQGKAELLKSENTVLTIPYSLSQKGTYHFDIIITEEISLAKYRNFCNHEI